VATNRHIGEKFGLTYSAVSQRVSVVNRILNDDKQLQRKYRHIKSPLKVWHRDFHSYGSKISRKASRPWWKCRRRNGKNA